MSVRAIAKNVRISPRKVSLVASLVRNRSVDDAIAILEYTPKKAAIAVKKTILSAKANAVTNHNYLAKDLKITQISVTPGRALKRYRPVARGSAHPFKRKSSHIYVLIDGITRPAKTNKTESKDTKSKKKDQ